MIKSFLLITWRSMMKNKFYIFINILGVAIAIACTIVAYFNLEFDRTFDMTYVKRESIYRVSSVREFDNRPTLYGFAPLPLGNVIRENIADVDKVVRLSRSFSNFKVDDNLFRADLAYADSDFFEVFNFEMIAGNTAEMKDKSRIFLTDKMALKLFGTVNAVGRPLTQVTGQGLKEYIVGGVFRKAPANSSFNDFSAFTSYENYFDEANNVREDDWRERNSLFVEIKDGARMPAVRNALQVYRENNNKVREDFQIREFVLDPLVGMAQRDEANDTWTQTRPANPRASVVAPMIMAVLILLIACFNMTNTAIAISSRRLKEIGVRKVMGSMRGQLIGQFLGETTFMCTIALVLGLFLGEILLRAWNELWENMKLTSHYLDNPGFLLFMIGTLAFTALLAGGYPAFYVSHFKPAAILKGKLQFGGTNYFTRVLLGLQYSISLIAVIFAIAFYGNSVYQENLDMGFDAKGVITAYVENQGDFETYRNALLSDNDIMSVAGSRHSLFSSRYNDPVKYQSKQLEVDIMDVGDDYLKTMGMSLVEGRDFRRDSETDRKESIIVTKKFADSFGWDQALGKEIIWKDTVRLYVIGVVKDVYTEGVWREMEPMMLRYTSPDKYTHVLVSGPLARLRDINDFMKEEWKKIFPNRLYNGWYISSGLTQAVTVSRNIVKIFAFMGVVALLLSLSGLFSLVSLNIIRKMKEIGVRKVLGASIANITRIINTEFVIILAVSSVVGCVLSYFLVDLLMANIWKYYQSATGVTFVVSVFLMFACSGIAIGYKVFSAASMNPVNTLRDE